MSKHFPAKRNHRGSVIADFGPALFLVFAIFFFPVVNMIGLGVGWATVVLVSSQSATAAAGSDTYGLALQNASNTSTSLIGSALATFARLKPIGGYNNSGTDLYVAATGIGGGSTIFYGPNTPVPTTIDPTSNIYEFEARSTFQIGPFVNMSGIPVLGSVPGLGKPAVFSFTTQRAAEYPSGLNGAGIIAGDSGPTSNNGSGTNYGNSGTASSGSIGTSPTLFSGPTSTGPVNGNMPTISVSPYNSSSNTSSSTSTSNSTSSTSSIPVTISSNPPTSSTSTSTGPSNTSSTTSSFDPSIFYGPKDGQNEIENDSNPANKGRSVQDPSQGNDSLPVGPRGQQNTTQNSSNSSTDQTTNTTSTWSPSLDPNTQINAPPPF